MVCIPQGIRLPRVRSTTFHIEIVCKVTLKNKILKLLTIFRLYISQTGETLPNFISEAHSKMLFIGYIQSCYGSFSLISCKMLFQTYAYQGLGTPHLQYIISRYYKEGSTLFPWHTFPLGYAYHGPRIPDL